MREVLLTNTTLVIPIMMLIYFSQIIIATLGFSCIVMKQQQPQQQRTQQHRLLQMTTTSLFLTSSSSEEEEEKKNDYGENIIYSSSLLSYQEKNQDEESVVASLSGRQIIIANNMTLLPPAQLKMIVFDKDGTLGDDSGSLKKWMTHMTDCFTEYLTSSSSSSSSRNYSYSESEISTILQSLHNKLGWNSTIQNVIPSAPLAVNTWEESIEICCTVLAEVELCSHGGLSISASDDAIRTLPRQWHAKLQNVHGFDPPIIPIPNLIKMIQSCRDMGLMVAICTSDDRLSTNSALQNWNITNLIDYSICGDEVGTTSKPSAVPLELLCQQTQTQIAGIGATNHIITPQECIIVGDTIGDTGMARNAKAGLCIGVLSGSGNEQQLIETGANIIIPNVGHLPELLLELFTT